MAMHTRSLSMQGAYQIRAVTVASYIISASVTKLCSGISVLKLATHAR